MRGVILRAAWIVGGWGIACGSVVGQSPALLPPHAAAASPTAVETFEPWWNGAVGEALKSEAAPLTLDLESAVVGALIHSPRLQIAADAPLVRQAAVDEAEARFDVQAFLDTRFTDTSDPVGNLLTTGGAPRYIDQTWNYSGGVRKTLTTGAQLEVAQRFGYQDNNSLFFVPAPQGTSRIVLTATQPLLNGRGALYNTSLIALAEVHTARSFDQLHAELQDLLFEVHQAYWQLRRERAVWLQRSRLQRRAGALVAELRGRRDFDVVRSQLVRAEAAEAEREASVIRLRTTVDNAETRLRLLMNDPRISAGSGWELIPVQPPERNAVPIDLEATLHAALRRRPELQAALQEVRAAGIRAEVARHELLPVLNLVMQTYVAGLAGQGSIGQAWTQQFTDGRPTYAAGLQFEVPWGRRAATARQTQRLVELRQATQHLQQRTIEVRAEVEVAVREVQTTHRELWSRAHALRAAEAEVEFLNERWRLLPGDQQIVGLWLDNLLQAQERLADREQDYARAEAAFNVALAAVRRAAGTLLDVSPVAPWVGQGGGLTSLPPATSLPIPAPEMQQAPERGAWRSSSIASEGDVGRH